MFMLLERETVAHFLMTLTSIQRSQWAEDTGILPCPCDKELTHSVGIQKRSVSSSDAMLLWLSKFVQYW